MTPVARFHMLWSMFALAGLACERARLVTLSDDDLRLMDEIGFDERAMTIAKGISADLGRMQALSDGGEYYDAAGLTIALPGERAGEAVARLNEELAPLGYRAYHRKQSFGYEPDIVAILRGDDQYAFLRMVRTDGINYGLEHEDVVAKIREWDERYGLRIIGADLDWLSARIERPPADMHAFAREVYEFCPDVVDQGTGTVEGLAREMKRRGTLYLWWD